MTAGRERALLTSTIPVTLDKFHRELIRQLADRYDVHIVSSAGPSLEALRRDLGVTVHALDMSREISLWSDISALYHWIRLVKRVGPSVVITATPKASLLGQASSWMFRVPQRMYYLGGLRLEGEVGIRLKVLSSMEMLTAAMSTVIVANSPSLASKFTEMGLAPASKVHRTTPGSSHGVDSEHFAPRPPDTVLAQSLGILLGNPVIGFVGRLTHDKGLDTLVTAAEMLKSHAPDAQLLVVGSQDEPDSRRYLALLRSSGLRVVTVDFVEDVRPFLSLMTFLVLPSLREGFPNVVLEAAAMGIPAVTTTATGAVDSVTDRETGLVVPVNDARALADAASFLLEHPDECRDFGRAARERVTRDYSPHDVVRSLLAPLRNI